MLTLKPITNRKPSHADPMNKFEQDLSNDLAPLEPTKKFQSPNWTAKGEERARVPLTKLSTLWINTGSLCNIECVNCYIESSPTNDRLVYISRDEVSALLDEIEALNLGTTEIAFTGGEPFLNPDIIAMTEDALVRGFSALILTNAMKPMQRPQIKAGLLDLKERFNDKLTLRVSLDHYGKTMHDSLRGKGSFTKTIEGMDWLSENGFSIAIAGRTCWHEDTKAVETGYSALIEKKGWDIDPNDKSRLVLFPEMDETVDVPEITTKCWDILGLNPASIMCAQSRMVVKRKGEDRLSILPCTLLPYDEAFHMGASLGEAAKADGGMFEDGAVKLCHPHCAKFCVLGGGSCSA